MVSVIIPNFNRAYYLEQALLSVMGQSYLDWEALVVDDGSSDSSKSLVETFAKSDHRIQWIERQAEPKGAANCRNIGIEKAKGGYVVFLDSDDVLASQCLEQRVAVMEAQPKLDYAVFRMQFFTETPGDDTRVWNLETEEATLSRFLKLDSVWQTSGPIWKRSALATIGGFNPLLACWQDIDIHLKALFGNLNCKICYDLPVDCFYRKASTDSISQSNTNSLEKLNSKIALYEWARPKTEAIGADSTFIALHILLSALTGHQFRIYHQFYTSVKPYLSADVKNTLLKLFIIKGLRFYKISSVQERYKQLKSTLMQETTIGTFHV